MHTYYLMAIIITSLALSMPSLAEETSILYFDLLESLENMPEDTVLRYDALKLVSALQGLANRDKPRLLIRFLNAEGPSGPINVDAYWLKILQEGWLHNRKIKNTVSLKTLLDSFIDSFKGYVMWDPAVPATANVAATMCGVENLLPIRYNSPLIPFMESLGIKINIEENLVGLFTGAETGSAKCDAYLWAKRRYLDTGKCNPELMAFYIDAYTQQPGQPGFQYTDLPNSTLANHDYYIARKAFFFDLLVWPDEHPVDDPNQPLGTDRNTLVQLLLAQYKNNGGKRFTTIGGFVSWNLKYTDHGPAGGKHAPVPTEWEYVALFSTYNAILDADALGLICLPNASAYSHYPLKETYTQHPRPQTPALENKTYALIYMGDYDSAAWLSRNIPRIWDDPARGQFPIAWAFNPNLSDRVPYVFDHVYATASPNDWFIAGDSGAGYLNPNLLVGKRLDSGLPDALDLWVNHNLHYYQKFDYSITGFVINGFHGKMPLRVQQAYTKFSPDGVGMQLGFQQNLVGKTPFITHTSDIYPKEDNIAGTADEMATFVGNKRPRFLIFRWILQTPSTMQQVMKSLQERHEAQQWEFCDPYTFFALYREYLNTGGRPRARVLDFLDSLPGS